MASAQVSPVEHETAEPIMEVEDSKEEVVFDEEDEKAELKEENVEEEEYKLAASSPIIEKAVPPTTEGHVAKAGESTEDDEEVKVEVEDEADAEAEAEAEEGNKVEACKQASCCSRKH
ncbi:hypothetical protein L1049_005249 [Liquidambar formosana]|uniref:Uncharacterized protein n=1 Tax=Liquidambar formosana TaxID=63359 RepID=A0AAP0RUQ8_LIQFO